VATPGDCNLPSSLKNEGSLAQPVRHASMRRFVLQKVRVFGVSPPLPKGGPLSFSFHAFFPPFFSAHHHALSSACGSSRSHSRDVEFVSADTAFKTDLDRLVLCFCLFFLGRAKKKKY
jgi:hypothetical protein